MDKPPPQLDQFIPQFPIWQVARDTPCLSKFIPKGRQLRYHGLIIGVTLDVVVQVYGEEKRKGERKDGILCVMCRGFNVSLPSESLSEV